jgi:hypothetical protein
MARFEPRRGRRARLRFLPRRPLRSALAMLALVAVPLATSVADPAATPAGTTYYSTAAPPADFSGPSPVLLALADPPATSTPTEVAPEKPAVVKPVAESTQPPAPAEVPRLATAPPSVRPSIAPSRIEPIKPAPKPLAESAAPDPIAEARALIADCKDRYRRVQDYTCTFFKRERINGKLGSTHVMAMKAQTKPFSVYFKFVKPNAGREAIYVAGRNSGRAVVHDVGLGKLLAGTLKLDPRSEMAMEDCRHPITEAGLGHLIDTIDSAWARELKTGESQIVLHRGARVGNRVCTMVESTHPQRSAQYMFHKVKLYIDDELHLPIRFEAYDWPRHPGLAADLVEEYTYTNLRLNVGLGVRDFDPANEQYSFGRF